jgi:hypothetical protein
VNAPCTPVKVIVPLLGVEFTVSTSITITML